MLHEGSPVVFVLMGHNKARAARRYALPGVVFRGVQIKDAFDDTR
jgi:hypothetical protein